MTKLCTIICFLFAVLLVKPSLSYPPKEPTERLWLTENKRSVIKIFQCEDGICGNIHWIIEGGMQTDSNNPDESRRNTPMCGLPILWGLEKEQAGVWENGNIYKADDGYLYSADIEFQEDGTLKVRGYLGVSWLGKTQIWNRVSASDYKQCL